ncbi:hypothetical protein KFL_003220020 [Klebsormidium nitens]|uniref:RING-type domain-containing protein n=1 Tax=Klebsormidium nitens TaxID=105231 RepID=A0A1Y1I7L9_KLENI|nr:hypothetical protein KFL_003220020 [Klebsormidium nitens]|eukprot:GAQ86940.1 hypothetical protein KFL_003220020 [Klebsormidium nitens]
MKAYVRTTNEERVKQKLLQGLDRLERAHRLELSTKTGMPATNGGERADNTNELQRLNQTIQSYRKYFEDLKQTTKSLKTEVQRQLTEKVKEVETLTSELRALRNNVQAWTEREDASRKEADEHSGCGICFEAWSKEVRRAAFDCGHATSCIDCSRDYLESEFARANNAKRPTFKCPLGCALKSKHLIELYL